MKDKAEMWIRDNLCIYDDRDPPTYKGPFRIYDYEGDGYDLLGVYSERIGKNSSRGYGYLYDPGYGYGDGHGYSSNAGNGIGSCAISKCDVFGELISRVNGRKVYRINKIPIIIEYIRGDYLKGYRLNGDFTCETCYVVKGNGHFVFGKCLDDARDELISEYIYSWESINLYEEIVERLILLFKRKRRYSGQKLRKWYEYFCGFRYLSTREYRHLCKCKKFSFSSTVMYTMEEFIALCECDYFEYFSDVDYEDLAQPKELYRLKERWAD